MSYPYPQQPQPTLVPPVIPFWPLTLGQLFSGMFAAVRANAGVMFTISMAATAVTGVLMGIVSAVMSPVDIDADFWDTGTGGLPDVSGIWSFAEFGVSLLSSVVLLFVGGMLILSVVNSVVAKKLTLGQTWQQLRPCLWRLIGASLLVWLLVGVSGGILLVAAIALPALGIALTETAVWPWILLMVFAVLAVLVFMVWVGVRLYFVTQVVVVEGATPGVALKRSWTLTRGAFWRIFGRSLLLGLLVSATVGLVVGFVSFFLFMIAAFAGSSTALATFLVTLLSMLVSGAVLPFTSSYSALMYVDERIRKENLAPALSDAFVANS